uniref:DAZ interacting zinc finger protein 1-like n=1 Tax=Astyanax mexicanus TaxID=7994 RepID=A0A8B9HYM1_ASTMX
MPGQFSPAEPRSPLVTPLSWRTGPPALPFHFRSRTEPMDWRRLSALDVDRVAREMDINVLQEFITAVTFCDAESERCPHCRGATDPTLLKVLRMSQLSTEYLLHCQDYLSTQVSALEERLHGALSQNQRDTEEQARLEKELQEVKLESRRRKKMISTQQLLLQASANNYHKCQFCEKSFVNYSYLQSHIQRRHPEITDAERQKKKQVEQMEDGIEELKEKLRLTQLKLAAEKEADAHQRQQEQEEQRRRETAEKEAMERWKEEERKKFQQEIQELRQLFLQEFKGMANRSFSIENKLQELESREQSGSPVRGEDEVESERRLVKEKQLKEHMAQKRNEWRKKVKELQNLHQQEKEELQSENVRLQRALTVEHSSSSSLQNLKQQLLSLSSQIKQKDRLIRSHEQKVRGLDVYYTVMSCAVWDSAGLEDSMEAQRKVLESLRGNSKLMKEFRPILEETLEERLEKMGLRKGTKGISKQTLKSLSSVVSAQRLQRTRSQVHLQDLRENLVLELNTRMKDLQKNQNIKSSATHTQRKHRSIYIYIPVTPPFSSEEDESAEDSAYITSSRGKPSPSTHITPPADQHKPSTELDWSDSDTSEESDQPKGLQVSEEESDLDLSSIEDLTALPTGPHRSSDMGGTSGTSVWSSAASRARVW